MVNRLDPLNLMDFTGGLNLRRNQFQLAENESPDLLNVDIDPRGGFYTRKGWQRWNDNDIVDPETIPWEPRNAFVHTKALGEQDVYVVNATTIYVAGINRVFAPVAGVTANAEPHGADFVAWGDDAYIAYRHVQRLGQAWSDRDGDSARPRRMVGGRPADRQRHAPGRVRAGHAGYMFIAVTEEAGQSMLRPRPLVASGTS